MQTYTLSTPAGVFTIDAPTVFEATYEALRETGARTAEVAVLSAEKTSTQAHNEDQ